MPSAPFQIEVVTPNTGGIEGGESIVVLGKGFEGTPALYIGAMPATSVVRTSSTQLDAITPPGTPGHADVRVVQSGQESVLPKGYEYAGTDLALNLVSPSMIARAGGTYLRVTGTAFSPDAVVTIGGEEASFVSFISSSELCAAQMDVGTYDAQVFSEGATALLPATVTVYDPQSGYSGTWGGPIDGRQM